MCIRPVPVLRVCVFATLTAWRGVYSQIRYARKPIGYNCNQFQLINVGWCEGVGDVAVMSLESGCPNLHLLHVCGCISITG